MREMQRLDLPYGIASNLNCGSMAGADFREVRGIAALGWERVKAGAILD